MAQVTFSQTHNDCSRMALVDAALTNGEGVLSATGALAVTTGRRTGRSPKDRFIVRDELTDATVAWGVVNQPIEPRYFAALWQRTCDYLAQRAVYVSHLRVGADDEHFLPVKVITETAWHNLFARTLFIEPQGDYAATKQPWTLMSAPNLHTDPTTDGVHSDGAVIINLSARQVLLVGMPYAGEMKKAMFAVLNFFLPMQGVLPMHCAANMDDQGEVALFFGLSGTGKTTLSADPNRHLIGDDEHGWSRQGVFNFEGGCYAKCLDLSPEREPVIWNAIRHGAIMENVVLKENNQPDYHNNSLTQNSRVAYPRTHIPAAVQANKGGLPKAVIFLTCDLYGVLPPVALLTREQAAYYFLSGYTALVGSTELGSTQGITPTFSACFGEPFFPQAATVYSELLMQRIVAAGCQVYLVNSGWTGGAYGEGGERFSIPTTRAVINAIVEDALLNQSTTLLPGFNIAVPTTVPGVASHLLSPRDTWHNAGAYDVQCNALIEKFRANFTRFAAPQAVRDAGPSR